jgi:hypothetical protein
MRSRHQIRSYSPLEGQVGGDLFGMSLQDSRVNFQLRVIVLNTPKENGEY